MAKMTKGSGQYSRVQIFGPAALAKYVEEQKSKIPSYDTLTRRESERVLEILAEHFKVAVPELRWRNRVRRGKALCEKNRISSGPDAWRGLTNCLLHEFAHILHFRRGDVGKAHGPEFQAALVDVVRVWHGDLAQYAWKEEYAHIARAYAKGQWSSVTQ